ncbi:hypothetical protein GD604_03970 [Desulfolutivibrio sulfoxidireducens]|nr:hypothetical protein GD604_03970 [Desulfolutivibrio sulfoxidireducens]
MATKSTTRFASTSQPFHLADVRAWAILKAICGHERGFFDEGPASLPVGPVRLPAGVVQGQGVRHE